MVWGGSFAQWQSHSHWERKGRVEEHEEGAVLCRRDHWSELGEGSWELAGGCIGHLFFFPLNHPSTAFPFPTLAYSVVSDYWQTACLHTNTTHSFTFPIFPREGHLAWCRERRGAGRETMANWTLILFFFLRKNKYWLAMVRVCRQPW